MVGRNILDGDIGWLRRERRAREGDGVLARATSGDGDHGLVCTTWAHGRLWSELAHGRAVLAVDRFEVLAVAVASTRVFPISTRRLIEGSKTDTRVPFH